MTYIETIERQALLAWFDAASQGAARECGWSLREAGNTLCSVAAEEPNILVNRALGLGLSDPPTIGQLRKICALYADAGVGRFFLHVVPEACGPERGKLLGNAGLEKYRGWMKFTRDCSDPDPAPSDLAVRRIGRDEAADFAAVAGSGFGFTAAFRGAIAALVDARGWQVFMTFDGATPAGTGAIFIQDKVAYLDFAATHPDFRRRGSQSAVLAARIHAARESGCESIVTMTGEAVPGDAQHSYRNIERAGFKPAYLRENWVPHSG